MTVGLADGRYYLYLLGLGFGEQRVAELILPNGIQDPYFQDDAAGNGELSRSYQYRPNRTGEDRVKRGARVTGSIWTHEMQAYSNTTDTAYEIVGRMHPDDLNDAFRRGQMRSHFETWQPVTPWIDGDFAHAELNGLWGWEGLAVNTTPAKSSVGGDYTQYGQTGPRNLVLTNNGADGYVPTSEAAVNPGDRILHGIAGRSVGGATAFYRLRDVTHDTVLDQQISFQSGAFQVVRAKTLIPAGCFSVQAEFGGVGASDVTEWDTTFGHLLDDEAGSIIAPSWMNEQWRMLGLSPATYGRTVAQGTNYQIFNASSRRWAEEWYNGQEFRLRPDAPSATPYTIQIDEPGGLPDRDMWIHGQRSFYDIEPLIDEDARSNIPIEHLMAGARFEIFNMLYGLHGNQAGMPQWDALATDAWFELTGRRIAQGRAVPKRLVTSYTPGGRGGLRGRGGWNGARGQW